MRRDDPPEGEGGAARQREERERGKSLDERGPETLAGDDPPGRALGGAAGLSAFNAGGTPSSARRERAGGASPPARES